MPGPSVRLTQLIARCEQDPARALAERTAGDELARQLGGELGLRWHLIVLGALVADPPDGDAVRELYGELVDRFRGDAACMAKLKPVGEDIRRREREGTLPSAMVARSERKKK